MLNKHTEEAMRLANDKPTRTDWVHNIAVLTSMALIVGTLIFGAAGMGVWWS